MGYQLAKLWEDVQAGKASGRTRGGGGRLSPIVPTVISASTNLLEVVIKVRDSPPSCSNALIIIITTIIIIIHVQSPSL